MRKINGRVLNWTPDLPDHRDFLFKIEAPRVLPGLVDLRSEMPPIVNQGSIGSCTANALAGNLGLLQMRELKQKGKQAHEFNSLKFLPASRLFIYFQARALIGMQNQDSGSFIRDGIKSLNQIGVCREDLWKYTTLNLYKKPTKGPLAEAAKYKISQYLRLGNLEQMRSCLADRQPFTFGFSVFQGLFDVDSSGVLQMPQPKQKVLGGHAVLVVGYDDSIKLFIVRNSWGSKWGDEGYFYMPYDYLNNPLLSSDFWTIRA